MITASHVKTISGHFLVATALAVSMLFAPVTSLEVSAAVKALPKVIVTSPAVKKSTTSICHAKGTRYYNQTKKFVAFKTLKDCLRSGGRLPKN